MKCGQWFYGMVYKVSVDVNRFFLVFEYSSSVTAKIVTEAVLVRSATEVTLQYTDISSSAYYGNSDPGVSIVIFETPGVQLCFVTKAFKIKVISNLLLALLPVGSHH